MDLRRNHQFDPWAPESAIYDEPVPGLEGLESGDFDMQSLLNLPSSAFKSAAEVGREASSRSKNIYESYEKLNAIILRHEATIRSRWAKKKKQQRLKVLLDAWPNMPTTHRPDFNAFRREGEARKEWGSKYRDYFLWPDINQDDLSNSKTLLLFINARGRHHPSEFAAADSQAMHMGRVTKALVAVFLNTYTMVLNGVSGKQSTEYGKLLSWDEHEDAFDWLHTRKQFLPGEGLLILEAQEKVMSFLVECCCQILHDIPADKLVTDEFPVQPEPAFKAEREATGFDSLMLMSVEAPYRLPTKLDFGRIESLLQARLSAAEDHIWTLREDPSYFADQLLDAKEHRQEVLKDHLGGIHPTLKANRTAIFWGRNISNVVTEAYLQLEAYAELANQAQHLQFLHNKYAKSISPSKDLPTEFLEAILKFRYYLNQSAKGPMNLLKTMVVASPPLRKYFVRLAPTDPSSSKIEIRSKGGAGMTKIEGELTWLLRMLWEDDYTLFLVTLPLALNELERLLQAEPEAKEAVSARVASVIGDLSILSQCLAQLDMYHPWALTFENALLDEGRDEIIKAEFAERTKPWAEIMSSQSDKVRAEMEKTGNPSGKTFFYPFDKRRSKENIMAMQQAERNLDIFWATVDRFVQAKNTQVRKFLSQDRILQRTPDWIEQPSTTAKTQGKEKTSNLNTEAIYKPLSTLFFGSQPKATGDDHHAGLSIRTKAKTKGAAKEDAEPLQEETQARDEITATSHEATPIHVDSRALKVFRTLFFNPAVTSSPGEVSWTDFLHAMTSTGMFAAEKLYGSVWQFEKIDGVDQSRIQFHEPHPRGKIPFLVARRHGRRLNRAFGWVGDMFILKEK